jgi:hypothetical protein
MTPEQAIQTLLNSQLLSVWEKDRSTSDPVGLKEIATAYQVLNPSYHIDWACNECIITLMNNANKVRNENKLTFHKFPKQ